jgi:ABC-2 type transport system permease protein
MSIHPKVAWAFLRRDFRIASSYRVAFVMQIAMIFVAVPLFYFMGNIVDGAQIKSLDAYGGNYFGFLLIGVALLDYLAVSLKSFGNSLRESQLTGTLEIVLLSPTSLIEVLLYSFLWFFLFTSVRFVLYLVVGAMFDLELGQANLVAGMLVLAVSVLSFIPFGIFTAAIIMLIKRGDALNAMVAGASMFFGGVLFPVASMPQWMQWVAQLLPFTHALEGMRRAIQTGAGVGDLTQTFLVLGAFIVLLMPLSWALFAHAVRHTRITGSLGHY